MRQNQWRIAALVFRQAPGRRSVLALAGASVAVATVILLLVASVVSGIDKRAERQAWLQPVASSHPVATQLTTTAFLDHRPVTVVHLAPVEGHGKNLPAPPGMGEFPAPGEVSLSPALARDLAGRGDALGLGPRASTALRLGESALTGPDQYVAVVGHRPADPVMAAPSFRDVTKTLNVSGPVAIASFAGSVNESFLEQYAASALLAGALLIIPVMGLVSAAAGLGAQTRATRFARLRLAGTPRGVLVRMVGIEAALIAGAGVVAGWLIHLAVLPAVRHVPLDGTAFFTGDLLVPVPTMLLLAVFTAWLVLLRLYSLARNAIRRPLVTAEALPTTLPLWWRIGMSVVAAVAFLAAKGQQDVSLVTILVILLLVFGSVAVLGPIGIAVSARLMILRRSAAHLIAGRRLLGDPRAAWRPVSGVVLAGFVAGFFAFMGPDTSADMSEAGNSVETVVIQGTAPQAMQRLERELRDRGVAASVTRSSRSTGGVSNIYASSGTSETLSVSVDSTAARAAIQAAVPGAPSASRGDARAARSVYTQDIQVASTVILLASFVLAIASLSVSAVTGIGERRQSLRRLRAAGTPLEVLVRARRHEMLGPLVAGTLGAAAVGALLCAPFMLFGGGLPISGVVRLAVTLAVGVLGAVLSLRQTERLLARQSQP